ncbi:hypothetical protein ACWD9K_36705 [Streptomyces sp. 900116325]
MVLSVAGAEQLRFGTREVAGPEEFRLDGLTKLLAARVDMRDVITVAHDCFLGSEFKEGTLLPRTHAHMGRTAFGEPLAQR